MNKENLACLGFSLINGVGPVVFKELLDSFKTANKAYSATFFQLNKILGKILSEKIIKERARDLNKYLDSLREKNINYVGFTDKNYPYLLKQIPDPPIGLFYYGNLQNYNWQDDMFLAIVGTRRPSQYGKKITEEWARALSTKNIILVSGLAAGIDTLVHLGAVSSKKRTIAVLGSNIGYIYPSSNRGLVKEIVKHNGLVLSEFCPETKVSKAMFVSRNRIIAGLCKATLIIEGAKHSGTLITARYSLNQGREVLVLPGQVDNPNSAAGLIMLQNGAIAVSTVSEVIEAL